MHPSSRWPRVLSCPREGGLLERVEFRGGARHAETNASPTDSFAACVRRRRLRGSLLATYREAGDHLAREGEGSAMPPLDLRHASRGARARLRSADTSGAWTCPNACLVQGGGLAEVLNLDGRFWAADKLILAYLAGTGALVAVYWNRLPEAPELLALQVGAAIAIVLASTCGGRAVWHFRHWYPLPLVASFYGDGDPDSSGPQRGHRPMERGSRLFDLACKSDRLAGAHPNAGAQGLSATCLCSVCSSGPVGPVAVVAETTLRGLSVLRFSDLAGLCGVLYRVQPCACARAPLLARSLTAFVFTRRMGGAGDAGDD